MFAWTNCETAHLKFPYQKRQIKTCWSVSPWVPRRFGLFLWCGHVCVQTNTLLPPPERPDTDATAHTSPSTRHIPICLYTTLEKWGWWLVTSGYWLFLLLSPGVPDRYHLRPDLGGHPPALQQQQHQDADSYPQQVNLIVWGWWWWKHRAAGHHNLDIGNNGMLGFKRLRSNSESLLRVFLSLQAPTFSYWEYLIWEQYSSLTQEEACN